MQLHDPPKQSADAQIVRLQTEPTIARFYLQLFDAINQRASVSKFVRLSSMRLRLTPMSEYPVREAERN
jgi:hypothetical protein